MVRSRSRYGKAVSSLVNKSHLPNRADLAQPSCSLTIKWLFNILLIINRILTMYLDVYLCVVAPFNSAGNNVQFACLASTAAP